jgi:hypothetical protein
MNVVTVDVPALKVSLGVAATGEGGARLLCNAARTAAEHSMSSRWFGGTKIKNNEIKSM